MAGGNEEEKLAKFVDSVNYGDLITNYENRVEKVSCFLLPPAGKQKQKQGIKQYERQRFRPYQITVILSAVSNFTGNFRESFTFTFVKSIELKEGVGRKT